MKNILKHVAIIMDGNFRWAKSRNLPKNFGHKKGAENIYNIILGAKKFEIKYLTFFAFSTENQKRSKDEIEYLIKILDDFLKVKNLDKFNKNNIKLKFIGDFSFFSKGIQNSIFLAECITKNNFGLFLTIALNYGGRNEIIRAINKILKENKKNINEKDFIEYLDTNELPDPDLLIRTGGKHRLSNFLLWQMAYTEIYITETFWPDFKEEEFKSIIENFYNLEIRNFGGRIE